MQFNYISSFFFIDLEIRFLINPQPDSILPFLPCQIHKQIEIQLAERKVGTIISNIKCPGSTKKNRMLHTIAHPLYT